MTLTGLFALISLLMLLALLVVINRLRRVSRENQEHNTELKEHISRNRDELFINETGMELAALIRISNTDLQELCDKVLFKLCEKLEAGYGCMLLLDQKQQMLSLISQFAYDQKRMPEKWIKPGSTLAGEVFLEDKPRLVSDLPEDYVNINSGLGHSRSLELLLIPMHFNGVRIGVVELAGFKAFTTVHLEIAANVSEIFSATLMSARSQEENRRLLKESQEKSDVLKQKEIELEQSIAGLKKAQQDIEETRAVSAKRIEEQLVSQQQLMEKIVKKYETHEKSLRTQIDALTIENEKLKSSNH